MANKFVGSGRNKLGNICFPKLYDTGKKKPNTKDYEEDTGEAQVFGRKKIITERIWQGNEEGNYKAYAGDINFPAEDNVNCIAIENDGCDSSNENPKEIYEVRKEDKNFARCEDANQNTCKNYNNYTDVRIQPQTTTEKIVYYLLLNEYFLLFVTVIFGILSYVYYLNNNRLVEVIAIASVFLIIIFLVSEMARFYAKRKGWF